MMNNSVAMLLLLQLLFLPLFSFGQTSKIEYNRAYLSLDRLPPLQSDRGKWGMFFWEFGDGHYQIVESRKGEVAYRYPGAPLKPARVYLTPYYTKLDKPVKVEGFPPNVPARSGAPAQEYELGNMLVHLETSAGSDNLLIPGHKVRVAVHYKNPSNLNAPASGFVMVFMNPKKPDGFSVRYPAFKYLPGEEGLYYGERYRGDQFLLIQSALPEGAAADLEGLRLAYRNVHIFETDLVEPGEERRLFFTIQSDERLRDHEAKDRSLDFKAVWAPRGAAFDQARQIDTYEMRIDSIHDPNRIRVRPKVTYFTKNPKYSLKYIIDFQNVAEGIVDRLNIEVPIPKGLNSEKIQVIDDGKYKECVNPSDSSTIRCFKTDLIKAPEADTLSIRIYNADLLGKEGERTGLFNQHTKGQISFYIRPGGIKEKSTRTRATIRFVGADPITTNRATVRWRYRGIYLRGGYSFGQDVSGFQSDAYNVEDRITLGLSYEDAPLGTGLYYGAELSAGSFLFRRDTMGVSPDSLLQDGFMKQKETTRMINLDGHLRIGYQFFGIVRAYAMGGITVPIIGNTTLENGLSNDPEFPSDETRQTTGELQFGYFQKKQPATLYDEVFEPKRGPGFMAGAGLEIGKLDAFSVGGRYVVRKVRIYDGSCPVFHQFDVFLRVKLGGGF